MASINMKLFAAVLVMLMTISTISNVAAQEAPAPAPGPTSDASVFVPTAVASLVALSFGFLF
uniref:arabinogalactan protein 12-like n=1 Tax=Erigeron canadensis TaxID=72917 RepID=UPI001CB9401E|nr:arabinogalactan protein 12-like [Erigeron canadensis]